MEGRKVRTASLLIPFSCHVYGLQEVSNDLAVCKYLCPSPSGKIRFPSASTVPYVFVPPALVLSVGKVPMGHGNCGTILRSGYSTPCSSSPSLNEQCIHGANLLWHLEDGSLIGLVYTNFMS